MCPTVLIGLGGTGHDLLLQVKRRLVERFGKVPPCVSFLSIDIVDPETPFIQASNGQSVALDPFTERFVIGGASPEDWLENKQIAQWFPSNIKLAAIREGASQIRACGRLRLFSRYTEIVTTIKNAIFKATNHRNLKELDDSGISLSCQSGINVYIISSLAGGAGSGMLLDVAFNVRNLCDATTDITGILVMPRVFNYGPRTRHEPNAYAALKEVEFFMKIRETHSLTIDYGVDSIQVTEPPFDFTFLVDNLNEQKIHLNRDDMFSVVGEGIYLLIASRIGINHHNFLINIKGKLDASGKIRDRSTAYHSFGVASLATDLRKAETAEEACIESMLTQLGDDTRKQSLKRLFALASPLWSPDYRKIHLTHDTGWEMAFYGVFDAENFALKDSFMSEWESAWPPTFVSLFLKDRITLFRAKSGVPLFALSGMKELENAYYQQADRATCHVDARWQSFPDLIPTRNKI
jgi:hypothetical protein